MSSLPDVCHEMFPVSKYGDFSSLFSHSSALEIGNSAAIKVIQSSLRWGVVEIW